MISFTVHAIPVAQPRVKATIRGKHAGVYTPAGPIDSFKAQVRMQAAHSYSGSIEGRLLTGPLSVQLSFVFPRSKSQTWKKRPMPRLDHIKKPDLDNLAKAVMDSLNGLIWVDDAQVCALHVLKCIASGSEAAHVWVGIQELDENDY